MDRASKIFRNFVMPAILTVFVLPVVGEFSIEVAREQGFFEHPTERAEAIFNIVLAIRQQPWFWPALAFVFALTMGMWLDSVLFRHTRELARKDASRAPDRDKFFKETVLIADLVHGNSLLSGKSFERCLIRGPAYLKLQNHNTLEFCSVPNMAARHVTILPGGSSIFGAVILSRNNFKECHFENITFIGTEEDARVTLSGVNQMSTQDWRERYL